MDKYERRRLRLIELRDAKCDGMGSVMARLLGRHPSYITRMLYPEGKPGKKRIADDMIEVIEGVFGLSRGWLDTETSVSAPVIGRIQPEEPDILTVVDLMRAMNAAQRGEVLGYARRVAETSHAVGKANAAS